VVAKPDRTIKIPGVSPDGSLVRSPVPAFRFTGVIPLLWPRLSHSTPDTQFRVGSSLQAGLYARTPVQSDCCAFSGNYRLESNPERHDKAPLAAATGNDSQNKEVLKCEVNYSYTVRTIWFLCSAKASYHGSETCRLMNLRKNHLAGWFFRLQSKDYDYPLRISRRSYGLRTRRSYI
jgi:hypothetical protein